MSLWDHTRHKEGGVSEQSGPEGIRPRSGNHHLTPRLHDNISHIQDLFGQSPDITIRQFQWGSPRVPIAVVYTEGISNKDMINQFILHSLMIDTTFETLDCMLNDTNLFDLIKSNAISVGEVKIVKDWDGIILSILSGDTVVFIDGWTEVLVCGTKGGEMRSITEASSQVVIRGPKDGFTESIGTNVALIRRRIKSSQLWLESVKIGRVTQTDVAIMYIKGIANEKIVQEVMKRLNCIDIDAILESGYIEQQIQDKIITPFPTLYNTERPDSIAANLLEGRVAIFVDGTPFVLIAPTTFLMFFQAPEDYYHRFDVASAIRLVRFAAFIISLFVPSIYIAATTFHQEMIPTPLLISLIAQREGVPFPVFVEALLMELTFEILREAGIRMPRAIGQAVSIVGALVLGQAAVEAGIVAPAMVIVVALTGISSFVAPAYSLAMTIRLLRFAMMVVAALLGFYGIAILSIFILGHMCGLRSFGIPYMTSLAPFNLEDQKDIFVRFPSKWLFSRPHLISQKNTMRQDTDPKLDSQQGRQGGGTQ